VPGAGQPRRPDAGERAAAFYGSHRYVLDFLSEEVLERQTEPVREFLLETSVLERLSGGLCDAVTGRNDGQAMLEQVERANLFLVPLDEVRGWWRYHQLFADLLRARLQRQWPERVDQLHRDAAGRAEAHGLVDDAVRHALAAADQAWAARLVEQHADGLLVHSEGATLQRWLAALPAELVGARPRLCLAQARLAILGRRVEGVDALLDAAEHTWEGAAGAADPFEPAAGRTTSLLANVPATIALQRVILAELRGDADQTMRFASRTLTLPGEGEWMLATLAHAHLAVAEWLRGRLPEAERAFTANVAQWRARGEPFPAVWSSRQLAEVQRARGHLDAALETTRLPRPAGARVRPGPGGHRSVRPGGPGDGGRPGRAAEPARAGGAAPARLGQTEPADRRGAGGGARHGQEARRPHPQQAGGGQPYRGVRPRPRARPAALTPAPARTPIGGPFGPGRRGGRRNLPPGGSPLG